MQIAAVREGKYEKPDLVFESGEAFSVNSTNNRTLMRAYGSNSDEWVGKDIELALGKIKFQGEWQDAVIVKPISPPIAAAGKKQAGLTTSLRTTRSREYEQRHECCVPGCYQRANRRDFHGGARRRCLIGADNN